MTLVIGIASLIFITTSEQLQESTTKDCNYAVDVWWLTVTPPSLSPIPAPTNEPTEPTRSPTPQPTNVNQTLTTKLLPPNIDGDANEEESESALSTVFLLHPYSMRECYSMNVTSEPFNAVSWKYTCKDDSTLTREIWWDSLNCDGVDKVTTDITTAQRGVSTTFICDQARDCATVQISVITANTMSPTPEPTDTPTTSPTREPTVINQTIFKCDIIGCLEDYNNSLPCQCYEGCLSQGDCCSDYERECDIRFLGDDTASGNDGLLDCSNTLGPNPNARSMFEWEYATNICVSKLDFSLFLGEDVNISAINYTVDSVGWHCVGNSYYLATFNSTDCSGFAKKYIQYTNDSCALGGGAWSYVECSEEFVIPTKTPTTRPITERPTNINVNGGGCRDACESDQLCVESTGECQDTIIDDGCENDDGCTAAGDDYKCKQSDGFCYFSECENDNGCAAFFNCERVSGEYTDIEYEYGICETVDAGNPGVAQRDGILIVIGLVLWVLSFV